MIKVLFICHGNICRSPMAEFIFKDIVIKNEKEDMFIVESRATSSEELGNGIYYAAKEVLNRRGIPFDANKYAQRLTKSDYENFDYLIYMDDWNLYGINKIISEDVYGKVHKLLTYAGLSRDVEDPWYSRNFDKAFDDIMLGCTKLYDFLLKNHN